ncbi:MAG: hypothetical protein ACLPT4_09520 [Verrucomicrobiia bacterium]
MNQLKPIVASLSFVGLFLAAVMALEAAIFSDSGRWAAVAGMGMMALYFLLCFLSCLSFVRGPAMISMAVLAHVVFAALLVYDLRNFARHNIHVELVLAPVWLLFVILYALMVEARLRER